jgi:DNA-binding CsgD family transcriptional regulator
VAAPVGNDLELDVIFRAETGAGLTSPDLEFVAAARSSDSFQRQLSVLQMQAVDAVALPVLAVLHDGHLLFANRAGKAALHADQWLRRQGKQVVAGTHVSERQSLSRALSDFRCGRTTTLVLTDGVSGRQAVMTAAPLSRMVSPSASAGLIWLIPTTPPLAPLRQFAHAFGLTNAERRVLQQLVAGEELRQAAETLHISVHTARSHLKSIFRRTGRRSQGQLLALANRVATVQVV